MEDCSVGKNEILLIFSFCTKLSGLCFVDCQKFQYSVPIRPRRRLPISPRRQLNAIIEKRNIGENSGWSIYDKNDKLFSSQEVLDHLFGP